MENAIASEAALGQGLRAVFECVRWRLGPVVNNIEYLIVFNQYEINIRSAALDGPGLYVSCHAQALGVCPVAHPAQFFDGDVVALALLYAGVGKISERQQDDHHGAAEF